MYLLQYLLLPVVGVLFTYLAGLDADQGKFKHTVSLAEKLHKAYALQKLQSEKPKDYSGKYVMNYVGSEQHAVELGKSHGFQLVKEALKNLKNYFLFTDIDGRTQDQIEEAVKEMRKKDKQMKSLHKEEKTYPMGLTVTPEPLLTFNVTDAYWSKQWHLHPSTVPAHSVYEAWEKGYSGKGVVMAILDDGIDIDHNDLVDNYNTSLSFNFVYDAAGGVHIREDDGHGTKCAGIAAASKNNDCIIGVAYDTTIASLRILDEYSTESATAGALTHELDVIDIYSNSWGYPGYGAGFEPLRELEEAALIQGIMEGRNGKGAIYVFAAGNDGGDYDDCNAAGLVNSIYTISINALAADGSPASYSEQCTCITAATYGGQGDSLISTTARNDTCIDDFLGTSAACPMAAGIIALALQANPDLTWRDVQHLIAETSTYEGVSADAFQTNAVGKNVSVSYGFGVMNADEMVEAALTWKTVPEKISCVGETQSVYKCCTESVEATYDVKSCHIKYLEHVQVHVYYQAIWREYTEIHLVSPNGTDSKVLRQRRKDSSSSSAQWTFMTVFHWGEDPAGIWTIRMDDFLNCDNEVYLNEWTLTLHGTVTDPLAGAPEDGTLGGRCDVDTPCTEGMDCLLTFNVCVECSLPGYSVVNGFCAQDEKTGGYCNSTMTCDAEHSWCNVNNTCEVCDTGFRRYDDNCFEDGKLGGYCAYGQFCTEADVGCNGVISRCINCSNGYRVMRGYCTEDGTLYGYCDSNITCNTADSEACSPTNSWCMNCYEWYGRHIIDGVCMDDGTIGGYCSLTVLCTAGGSGCDLETNRCTVCTDEGFHIIDSVCRPDGVLHGYCNDTLSCQYTSGCDPNLNVCVDCTSSGYRIVKDGFCRQDGELDGYCNANIRCTPERSGCSAENNVCVICYAGHHLHNGFCVEGKYATDEAGTENEKLSAGTIVGSLLGGLASGVAMTAPVFLIMFKKATMVKIKSVTQNGGNNHYQNGI